jgi:hypothetical protein
VCFQETIGVQLWGGGGGVGGGQCVFVDNGPGARDHEDVVVQTRQDHVLFGVDLVVGGGWEPRGDDVVGWVSGWVSGWVHGGVGVMAPLEISKGGLLFS